MAVEGVGYPDILAVRPLFVGGVLADIADQKIEQAVVVVVEKKAPEEWATRSRPGFLGDIFEMSVAVVLEQCVAAANGCDEQILVAVVVDIGEGGATLIRPGSPTPASCVMFLNLPPPRFFQSSFPPT